MVAFLFYFFGAGALLAGANVVMRRHAVPAAIWLVTCFFFLAGEFLLLGAPFLAAVQIMVYVGAIMVLFLFVIMLLDLRGIQSVQGQTRRAAGMGLAAVIAATAVTGMAASETAGGSTPPLENWIQALFTTYLLPFEVTSVLLVAAIVGALTLGRSGQSAGPQSEAPEKTIRLVSGRPGAEEPEAVEAARP